MNKMAIDKPDYGFDGGFFTWKGILNKKGQHISNSNVCFLLLIFILFCNPYQQVSIVYLKLLSLIQIKSICSFMTVPYMKY